MDPWGLFVGTTRPATILNKEMNILMDTQTLTFTLERETKNTIRYTEATDGKPAAIGTIYLQKWLVGNTPPKKLPIIIDADAGPDE
jgi:hypothetical protein